MSPNPSPIPVGPLQRIVATPVTDPGELAAINQMRRQAREEITTRGGVRTRGAGASWTEFLDDVTEEELLDGMVRLLDRLPADALRQVARHIDDKLGG